MKRIINNHKLACMYKFHFDCMGLFLKMKAFILHKTDDCYTTKVKDVNLTSVKNVKLII